MYHVNFDLAQAEHDRFVQNHHQLNLLQAPKWALIKSNWASRRIGFYKETELVASVQVLIRPLPLGFTMIYLPRGPIMDYAKTDLLAFVMKTLRAFAKKQRALVLTCDPAIHLRRFSLNDKEAAGMATDQEAALLAIDNLVKTGLTWSGKTQVMSETIQPRYHANVYKKDYETAGLPKHSQRLRKDAIKRGVSIYRGGLSDLDDFMQVLSHTEGRKGISLRNKAYFEQILRTFDHDAHLYLARIRPQEQVQAFQEELGRVQFELQATKEHQLKRRHKLEQQEESLLRYLDEFQELFGLTPPKEVTIAGILGIKYGKSMELLYAGMNENFKRFYPQYHLYPYAFEAAFAEGCLWANMGGVEGSLDDGLSKFKANFNPQIEEYIGEFHLQISPFYPLFNWLIQQRKRIRKKLR